MTALYSIETAMALIQTGLEPGTVNASEVLCRPMRGHFAKRWRVHLKTFHKSVSIS